MCSRLRQCAADHMQLCVLAYREQLQVLSLVVQCVAIAMMHVLAPSQPATEHLFHDESMFGDASAVAIDIPISMIDVAGPVSGFQHARVQDVLVATLNSRGMHRADSHQRILPSATLDDRTLTAWNLAMCHCQDYSIDWSCKSFQP